MQTPPRPRLFLDALAVPMVGRSAQNVVHLPGMDLERFMGAEFSATSSLFDDCFEVGLNLEVPPLYAEIQRWGTRPGLPISQPQST